MNAFRKERDPMRNKPSFLDIEYFRKIYSDNELFTQFFNEELNDSYDANNMLLKFSPSLEEFILIEKIQDDYKEEHKQPHIKFLWPENIGIRPDVLEYLDANNYRVGMQNLYAANQHDLNIPSINEELVIKKVTPATLNDFIKMNIDEDDTYDENIKKYRQKLYTYQAKMTHVDFFIAYSHQLPVGSLVTIASKLFLEIDNVLTVPSFRNQKVASSLINYVIQNLAKNKSILIVADAEDTPRKIYEKIGFEFISSQIHVEKLLENTYL